MSELADSVRALENAWRRERERAERAERTIELYELTAKLQQRLGIARAHSGWVARIKLPGSTEMLRIPGDDPAEMLVAAVLTFLKRPAAFAIEVEPLSEHPGADATGHDSARANPESEVGGV